MKRYHIFIAAAFYPAGDMDDIVAVSDDIAAAKKFCEERDNVSDTMSIYDTLTDEHHQLFDVGWCTSALIIDPDTNSGVEGVTSVTWHPMNGW